jgi:hypothetical protein
MPRNLMITYVGIWLKPIVVKGPIFLSTFSKQSFDQLCIFI